jgi:hypothetical protein
MVTSPVNHGFGCALNIGYSNNDDSPMVLLEALPSSKKEMAHLPHRCICISIYIIIIIKNIICIYQLIFAPPPFLYPDFGSCGYFEGHSKPSEIVVETLPDQFPEEQTHMNKRTTSLPCSPTTSFIR